MIQKMVNKHGLVFEVDLIFRNEEWFMDSKNTAKAILYHDAKELLPKEEEEKQLGLMLEIGILDIVGNYGTIEMIGGLK